jgi:hypothetical protein
MEVRKYVENKKKSINLSFLPVFMSSVIEWSSFLDFFSDIRIIIALAKSKDTAWFAFCLITVLAPYYTIYTSLINNQIEQVRRKKGTTLMSFFELMFRLLTVLPTMLIMLICFDFVYMCFSVVAYLFLLPFSACSIGIYLYEIYESGQNCILKNLFGFTHMEIAGFRCQRTIL